MLHQIILLLAAAISLASATYYKPLLSADASDLFSHFTTFTGSDPANGFVNYTDMDFASQRGLVATRINDALGQTTAYIGVDHDNTASAPGRNSVRLLSRETFSIGSLFVLDVAHVPVGYGQWSALWLLGLDGIWPSSGEIDFFETVHMTTNNQVTLHTDAGCTVDQPDQNSAGQWMNPDCNADTGRQGCGFKLPDTVNLQDSSIKTAGQPFNDQNGGVLVLEWIESGINMWMFDRDYLPGTLKWDNPDSIGFPPPAAKFSGSGCNYDQSFRDMQLIINIDICGDWAGKDWNDSAAAATGVSTCEDFAANNPSAYNDAYFEIASLKVYSQNSA